MPRHPLEILPHCRSRHRTNASRESTLEYTGPAGQPMACHTFGRQHPRLHVGERQPNSPRGVRAVRVGVSRSTVSFTSNYSLSPFAAD